MRRYSVLIAIGFLFTLSGANCLDFLNNKPRVAGLKGFSSGEELRRYFASQASNSMRNNYRNPFPVFWDGLAMAPTDMATGGDAANGAEGGGSDRGDDYSGTNVQEAGVDESDLVKNDGNYIYALDKSTVHIASASPLAEVASIKLDSYGDSLYLYGNKLIALSQEYTYYPMPLLMDSPVRFGAGRASFAEIGEGSEEPSGEGGDPWEAEGDGITSGDDTSTNPDDGDDSSGDVDDNEIVGGPWNDGSQVLVTIIDVTDPANPVVEAKIRLEGSMASSRMIESKLHVVLTTTPRLPYDITLRELDEITLEEWLPDYEIVTTSGGKQSGDIVGWESVFRPLDEQGYGLTTVVTLDVTDPSGAPVSASVVADAGTIYASTESLYVTDTEYGWSGFWEITRTDTEIHKFRFTETGTEYAASGLVPGRPLNQYSLGEYQDYLRIATTEDDFTGNGNGTTNSVYVLGQQGDALNIVGSVENIGRGETIYSARFIRERGFVVTFRRTDPLFVIDLSDPTSPQMKGELVCPGYSDHIQLLDETHLLTIGKDAEPDGDWAWVKGVQLSVFDVSDMEHPQLQYRETIGGRGSNSEANYNPKAFSLWKPQGEDYGLLAFPIDVYDEGTSGNPWSYGDWKFSGLMVYRVSVANGFEYLGGISSVDTSEVNGCYWGYYGGYTRGVFIRDTVFSVTPNGVKAAAITDPSTITANVEFAGADPPYDYCGGWVEPMIMIPEEAVDLR
ncbi:MAG: beta-propeller domain-containing protein [Phycisphaerae bacterium]